MQPKIKNKVGISLLSKNKIKLKQTNSAKSAVQYNCKSNNNKNKETRKIIKTKDRLSGHGDCKSQDVLYCKVWMECDFIYIFV